MTPKTNALSTQESNAQVAQYEKVQKDFTEHLKQAPELVKTAKKLKESDQLFRLVLKPEGGKMFKDAQGNMRAVWYNDKGKIMQQARLQDVESDLLKPAKALGAQAALLNISVQLAEIDKKLDMMQLGLHDDRVSEVEGGINLFQDALIAESDLFKIATLNNATQSLHVALPKLIRAAKREIASLPSSEGGFLQDWGKTNTKAAQKKFPIIHELVEKIMKGSAALVQSYSLQGEHKLAASRMQKIVLELKAIDFKTVADQARLLPYIANKVEPEKIWLDLARKQKELNRAMESSAELMEGNIKELSFEMKPSMLIDEKTKEIDNDKM